MKYTFLIFIISIGFQACMTVTDKNDAAVWDLQGHRGCRGLYPENTIPAMMHALELGVNTLEMDAVVTGDGQVILSHEPFFNHEISTRPDGSWVEEADEKGLNIYTMPYDSVKRYDVGLKPHPRFPEQKKMAVHKPLLSQVIDSVQAWCERENKPLPFFNIETKCMPATDSVYHPGPEAFVELLMQVIQAKGIEEKVIIQSFDFRTLRYMHEKYPAVRLAALVEGYDSLTVAEQLVSLGFTPAIYSPAHEKVTAYMVEDCRKAGMLLIPWTVNDPKDADKLKVLGVDGLITDYPDRIR